MDDRSLEELQRRMDEHGIDVIEDNEMNLFSNNDEIFFREGPTYDDFRDSRDFAYDPEDENFGYEYEGPETSGLEENVEPEREKFYRNGPTDEDFRDPRDMVHDDDENYGYEYEGPETSGLEDDDLGRGPVIPGGTGTGPEGPGGPGGGSVGGDGDDSGSRSDDGSTDDDNNNNNNNNDDNNNDDDEPTEEEEHNKIEKLIDKFNKDCDKIKEHLERVVSSLVLDEVTEFAIDEIKELDSEVKFIDEQARELIGRIDEFRTKYSREDFSTNYKEITSELKTIKNDLKELKQMQIDSYNNTVDAINRRISELREFDDERINAVLNSLPELNRCDVTISNWTQIGYLSQINYDKIKEINGRLLEINNLQLGVETSDRTVNEENEVFIDLSYRIFDIETELKEIKNSIKDDITLDEINSLRSRWNTVSNDLISFGTRLEILKDKLTEEDYNKLFERYGLATDDLYDLKNELKEKGMTIAVEKDKVYKELRTRYDMLVNEKNHLNLLVNSLHGKINSLTAEVFLKNVDKILNDLNVLEQDSEKLCQEGKITKEQFEQLCSDINGLRPELEKIRNNIKHPEMVKDVDIYTILNGDIDGVEKAIEDLGKEIDSKNKPIKREDRKILDNKFKAIEKEIERLEKTLEQYKDKDPHKYNATKARLDNAKAELEKVGKKYRSKCPLHVRAVKSAKALYKKYKKPILISAGLIAFALVSSHVLIPAIMHGNIMMASTTPGLRGFMKVANNILGSVIGAKRTTDGLWILSSGVIINPLSGTSSLLKGLAVSGISSAALVGPVVISIKKLMEKMKVADLKQKLSSGKEKLNEEKDKLKDKVKPKEKNSNKKTEQKSKERLNVRTEKLYNEFINSGKTFEEFAVEKKLDEIDIILLQHHISKNEEVREVNEGRGRR